MTRACARRLFVTRADDLGRTVSRPDQQVPTKGGNAPMATEAATLRIAATDVPADVSAVLLTSKGQGSGR